MYTPEVYTARELKDWNTDDEVFPGLWTPARPISKPGLNLIRRVLIAWNVLIGKFDAVAWYNEKDGVPK